jgi:hypothetical protein
MIAARCQPANINLGQVSQALIALPQQLLALNRV